MILGPGSVLIWRLRACNRRPIVAKLGHYLGPGGHTPIGIKFAPGLRPPTDTDPAVVSDAQGGDGLRPAATDPGAPRRQPSGATGCPAGVCRHRAAAGPAGMGCRTHNVAG
jgi:hypothetical protein